MSREIKFRAWEKAAGGRMYHNFNIGIGGSSETDLFVLMQYTGLHDDKGKDIFDGDLLAISGCLYDDSTPQHKFIFPQGYVWRVLWCEEHLTWEIDCDPIDELHDLGAIKQWELRAEVIGNIYENPELTKEVLDGKR